MSAKVIRIYEKAKPEAKHLFKSKVWRRGYVPTLLLTTATVTLFLLSMMYQGMRPPVEVYEQKNWSYDYFLTHKAEMKALKSQVLECIAPFHFFWQTKELVREPAAWLDLPEHFFEKCADSIMKYIYMDELLSENNEIFREYKYAQSTDKELRERFTNIFFIAVPVVVSCMTVLLLGRRGRRVTEALVALPQSSTLVAKTTIKHLWYPEKFKNFILRLANVKPIGSLGTALAITAKCCKHILGQ